MAERQVKYDVTGDTLSITAEGQETLVLRESEVHPDIKLAVFMHGLKQKVGDEAARDKGTAVGEKFASMADMIARIKNGLWRATREGDGPRVGKTVKAFQRIIERGGKVGRKLIELLGLGDDHSLAAVQTAFASKDDNVRKVLMAAKEVKAELATMAAEEAETSETSLLG